jgi:hypothetical protein
MTGENEIDKGIRAGKGRLGRGKWLEALRVKTILRVKSVCCKGGVLTGHSMYCA